MPVRAMHEPFPQLDVGHHLSLAVHQRDRKPPFPLADERMLVLLASVGPRTLRSTALGNPRRATRLWALEIHERRQRHDDRNLVAYRTHAMVNPAQ